MVNRIKTLMEEKGISARKLTLELGLPSSAITEWSKGKARPSTEAIAKIANYFDVSTDYLINGKEKPQTVKYDSGLSENTILICRGGDTKELHFSKEQIEAIEKLLETIDTSDSDNL